VAAAKVTRRNKKTIKSGFIYLASHPCFLTVLKLGFGFIFIIASIGKIIDPAGFMEKVYEYSMLPDAFVPVFAYTLPWVEFIIGLLLMFDIYVQSAALIAIFSLIAFMIAIMVQVSRGVSMDCGCFDFMFPDEKTGWATISRDFIMICLASALLFFDKNELSVYGFVKKLKK